MSENKVHVEKFLYSDNQINQQKIAEMQSTWISTTVDPVQTSVLSWTVHPRTHVPCALSNKITNSNMLSNCFIFKKADINMSLLR